MCSHISSDSGGGGGGGDQYLKKQKKQRMRRRGPGVAELEKILREQENANTIKDKEIIIRSKFEGVSSCMLKPLPHSSSYRPRSSAITLSNSSLPFDLNCTALISPPPPSPLPKTSLYGNGSSNKCTLLGGGSANGDHNGLHIGGPGQALLPTAWGTCESSNNGKYPKFSSGVSIHVQSLNGSNQKIPSTPPLPKKHCQYSYTTINPFQQYVIPSLSTQSSAGLYHHIEPPSNQKHYPLLRPEEEKLVGKKRPLPFSMDNIQVPPFYPNIQKPDRSASCGNHGTLNLEPSKTLHRGVPLELKSKKCITDYGASNGNFITVGFPTSTPSPLNPIPQEEVCNSHSLAFCDSVDDTYKRPGPVGIVNKETCYSFLQSEEHLGRAETKPSIFNERNEPRSDGIDLNLKL